MGIMKGLAAFLIGVGKVNALEASKVAELLNFFESNQNRYQINVEQHCKMGDLPLMEYTDYGCKEVLERTLTHGKTCSFACIHDANVVGAAQCDNDEGAVTNGANCKWKFPDYSPSCGPLRMAWVNQELLDLENANDQTNGDVSNLQVAQTQLENTLSSITDDIAAVDAKADTNHDAALQAVTNEGNEQDLARDALNTLLSGQIDALEAADLTLWDTVNNNGNALSGAVTKADDNEEDIAAHGLRITQNEQDIAAQQTDLASLNSELSDEISGVLTSLNIQTAKQESDRSTM